MAEVIANSDRQVAHVGVTIDDILKALQTTQETKGSNIGNAMWSLWNKKYGGAMIGLGLGFISGLIASAVVVGITRRK